MNSLFVFWSMICFGCNSVVPRKLANGRRGDRFKRIIHGIELDSNDDLGTQYMVSIKKTHACDAAKVEFWNSWCEEYNHKCGGALVAPDMVVSNCHCMVFEHWHIKGIRNPPFHPSFDSWTSTTEKPKKPEELQTFYFKIQPVHPIFNLMSLWMGGVDIEELFQRKFAKAFFPHSDCTYRELFQLSGDNGTLRDELWSHERPNYDIGLIRTWEPFVINADVKLVGLVLGDELLKLHRNIMSKMSVCLLTGFGLTEYGFRAWKLRYSFRHMQCTNVCQLLPENIHPCEICSTSIARPDKNIPINWPGPGDSGSPIVCDHNGKRVLFSVHSQIVRDKFVFHVNASVSISVAVSCVRHLLTPDNMKYLREIDDQTYPEKFFKLDQIAMGPYEKDKYTGRTTVV